MDDGTYKKLRVGKKHSIETKKLLSEKMRILHATGKHPGWAHKNQDPNRRSFPEKFFKFYMK